MAIDSSTALSNLIGEWNSKMENLTCVLKELELMNQEGEINTEKFSIEDVIKTYKDTNAGADPVFLQKLSTKMIDPSKKFPPVFLHLTSTYSTPHAVHHSTSLQEKSEV